LFTTSSSYNLGKADSTNKATAHGTNYQLRVTVDHNGQVYSAIRKYHIYISTNGSKACNLTIEYTTNGSPDTWQTLKSGVSLSGWGGWNVIQTGGITVGGSTSSYYRKLRFTFKANGGDTSYVGMQLLRIYGFGGMGWTTPSTLASQDHLYSTSVDSNGYLNATFPHNITANYFNGDAKTSLMQSVLICNSLSSATTKTLTIEDYTTASYYRIFFARFINGNTANNPNLNVNNTGQFAIKIYGVRPNSTNALLRSDVVYRCMFNGAEWELTPYENTEKYSTTEQLTGRTWVDGKPIYRTVLTGTWADDGSVTLNVPFPDTNISQWINVIATLKDPNGFVPVYYQVDTDYFNLYFTSGGSNSRFVLRRGATSPKLPATYIIIAEYTKI
jgi:hypothetical protein